MFLCFHKAMELGLWRWPCPRSPFGNKGASRRAAQTCAGKRRQQGRQEDASGRGLPPTRGSQQRPFTHPQASGPQLLCTVYGKDVRRGQGRKGKGPSRPSREPLPCSSPAPHLGLSSIWEMGTRAALTLPQGCCEVKQDHEWRDSTVGLLCRSPP